ncbi:MAG: hypothetical protein AAFX76_13205, partial [Planctomycetota bacterium]
RQYGKIVNIGGTFGLRGRAGRLGYSASKWGMSDHAWCEPQVRQKWPDSGEAHAGAAANTHSRHTTTGTDLEELTTQSLLFDRLGNDCQVDLSSANVRLGRKMSTAVSWTMKKCMQA